MIGRIGTRKEEAFKLVSLHVRFSVEMSNAENNHEEPLPQHGHNRWNIADKSKTKENIKRQLKDLDVPLFDLLTITTATNNFSSNNKIGQGGFGPVYKVNSIFKHLTEKKATRVQDELLL
ncbi:hypothetical protein JHK86_016588 [Glycine max]|nr:hypothetical protein JHK86_016588 [Glycine max]